jgi:polar amino acid transport system substrate-binding protein
MRQLKFLVPIIIVGLIIVIIDTFVKYPNKHSNNNPAVFIVGTAAGYAPFVSVNQKGDYEGFDIDMANELAEQMGKKLVIQDLGSMAALFTALDQGSIDGILWGLSITQDRLKRVAMIRYQGETTRAYPLIFWNTIPQGVNSIAEMSGKTICVELASSQEMVLNKYPSINKLLIEKVDDGLLNIQYGKADAALVEPAIAKKFKNKYPQIQILDIPLMPEDQVQGIGIAIKQNNMQLIKQVNTAIEKLRNAGRVTQLEQKWGIEP